MDPIITFRPWPKTPRMFRDIVITEKIDGTNAAVIVKKLTEEELGEVDAFRLNEAGVLYPFTVIETDAEFWAVGAQSRNRLIYPEQDNAGFARWVFEHARALAELLGEGYHYGEWWGQGIQRRYDQDRKRFSLFNTERYSAILKAEENQPYRFLMPELGVVPELYRGPNHTEAVRECLHYLHKYGSKAAPGYMQPEGVVIFHSASREVYKALIEDDHISKSEALAQAVSA